MSTEQPFGPGSTTGETSAQYHDSGGLPTVAEVAEDLRRKASSLGLFVVGVEFQIDFTILRVDTTMSDVMDDLRLELGDCGPDLAGTSTFEYAIAHRSAAARQFQQAVQLGRRAECLILQRRPDDEERLRRSSQGPRCGVLGGHESGDGHLHRRCAGDDKAGSGTHQFPVQSSQLEISRWQCQRELDRVVPTRLRRLHQLAPTVVPQEQIEQVMPEPGLLGDTCPPLAKSVIQAQHRSGFTCLRGSERVMVGVRIMQFELRLGDDPAASVLELGERLGPIGVGNPVRVGWTADLDVPRRVDGDHET
jgi:hypothetical protein